MWFGKEQITGIHMVGCGVVFALIIDLEAPGIRTHSTDAAAKVPEILSGSPFTPSSTSKKRLHLGRTRKTS